MNKTKGKKYTVHLDLPFDGERNDYVIKVVAGSVRGATTKALLQVCKEMAFDKTEAREVLEVLDVYKGHVVSIWDRPKQAPTK